MDVGPVGQRALVGGDRHGRGEQQPLQPDLVELFRQRPGQAGPRGALEIVANRNMGHGQGAGNHPLSQAGFEVKTENVLDLAHG